MARKAKQSFAATVEAWLVVAAAGGTIWMLQSGTLAYVMDSSTALGPLAAFVAGLMYSTFVTTPLAIGSFYELAQTAPAVQIAALGALGATIIDLVLVKGIRSPLMDAILHAAFGNKLYAFARRLSRGRLRILSVLLGSALIAIPLPTDEVGVTFLGMSHMRAWKLAPFVFAADFVGIYLLVSAVKVFS
jgi:hypothetical protein